jgi:hypothetical protein
MVGGYQVAVHLPRKALEFMTDAQKHHVVGALAFSGAPALTALWLHCIFRVILFKGSSLFLWIESFL